MKCCLKNVPLIHKRLIEAVLGWKNISALRQDKSSGYTKNASNFCVTAKKVLTSSNAVLTERGRRKGAGNVERSQA